MSLCAIVPGIALLGAIGDWVTWIIVAVVMIVSFLNSLLSDAGKKKPPQIPRRPDGGGRPDAAGGQKTLMEEIDRFLKEAKQAAQNQGRPPRQQQPERPPQQQPQSQRPQQQMGRSLPSQQKPRQQQGKKKNQQGQQRREQQSQRPATAERGRLQPEIGELEEVRVGGDLSKLTNQHLPTSRFDERAERLSHLQQTVDTDIGGHVHTVFDHQIGSLSHGNSSAATAGSTADVSNPALQLIALLSDPNGMRNAVLMREILEPPTHRW